LKFKTLCEHIVSTGFDIFASPSYERLDHAQLIANTIKHGAGPSANLLLGKRPDLFPSTRNAEGLRVGEIEFERAFSAIDRLWFEYEDAYLKRTGRPPRTPCS
jgi:hypothetical protein